VQAELMARAWRPVVIWECELKQEPVLRARLADALEAPALTQS